MTRHDPPVQTAAPHRGPTGWFVPGATVTMIMHANLTDAVVVDARMQFERHSTGRRTTPYAAAHGRRPTTPNQKTP